MPDLPFSQALTANQQGFNPLSGWAFETVPYPQGAAVKLLVRTTGAAGTVRMTVQSGTTNIRQRSPVQVGGTAGVTPSELNTAPLVFVAGYLDRLILQIDETAGATPTVDGIVQIEPM